MISWFSDIFSIEIDLRFFFFFGMCHWICCSFLIRNVLLLLSRLSIIPLILILLTWVSSVLVSALPKRRILPVSNHSPMTLPWSVGCCLQSCLVSLLSTGFKSFLKAHSTSEMLIRNSQQNPLWKQNVFHLFIIFFIKLKGKKRVKVFLASCM